MKLHQKLITCAVAITVLAGCSTAYKSEPEKTVYFLEITEAGKDVKNITAKSGYFDGAVAGGVVGIGSQLGFSPSSILLAAVVGGLVNNSSNTVKPDEVFLTLNTSNSGTFRGVKQGRVKYNPEMLLWVKGDALKEFIMEDGRLSLRLADQDQAQKRRQLVNAAIKNVHEQN